MSDRLPTLFLGHGSPENALANNTYTRALSALADGLPRPKAVLVVSAHYMALGCAITGAEHPLTIHDFYRYPKSLYEVQYSAPGEPGLAREVADLLGGELDGRWGFDHACWSPMIHMWPAADIPTVVLSLDINLPASAHFAIGRKLSELPDRGVLLIGSGNVVHNLHALDWKFKGGFKSCETFDAAVAKRLEARDDEALIDYASLPGAAESVPSPGHYLPLLYAAAAAGSDAQATSIYEGLEMGALSMRCVQFG
jgi:4,5-DOPA dioxygenase extradiol